MTARKPNAASASQSGKAGRLTSPWRKGPMCDTGRAKASFIHYCRKGKRMSKNQETEVMTAQGKPQAGEVREGDVFHFRYSDEYRQERDALDAAILALSAPPAGGELLCVECGYMGTNFGTIHYPEGDADAECPECGATTVDEPATAISRIISERDTARAPEARPSVEVKDAIRALDTMLVPNDDDGIDAAKRHGVFIYEVDFGDEGKGRYVRLRDFNAVVQALESPAPPAVKAVEVDEAMVERALTSRAYREDGARWPDAYSDEEQKMERENMRADLAAALHLKKKKRIGRCKEKAKPGGCQLHNLHCGYPECDEFPEHGEGCGNG